MPLLAGPSGKRRRLDSSLDNPVRACRAVIGDWLTRMILQTVIRLRSEGCLRKAAIERSGCSQDLRSVCEQTLPSGWPLKDPSTVLHLVYRREATPGALVRTSTAEELRLPPCTAWQCMRTFLDFYTLKVRRAFCHSRRLSIAMDGSTFNGEELEQFIICSRSNQCMGVLHPQASGSVLSVLLCVGVCWSTKWEHAHRDRAMRCKEFQCNTAQCVSVPRGLHVW